MLIMGDCRVRLDATLRCFISGYRLGGASSYLHRDGTWHEFKCMFRTQEEAERVLAVWGHNTNLDRNGLYPIRICHADTHPRFYVEHTNMDMHDAGWRYLCRDGIWRNTMDEQGESSGWFGSRDHAMQTIREFYKF